MVLSRKECLITAAKRLAALGSVSVAAALLESCANPLSADGSPLSTINATKSGSTVTIDVGGNSPLANANSAAIVQYGTGMVLVAHGSNNAWHALSTVCTHQGCAVSN